MKFGSVIAVSTGCTGLSVSANYLCPETEYILKLLSSPDNSLNMLTNILATTSVGILATLTTY